MWTCLPVMLLAFGAVFQFNLGGRTGDATGQFA